MEKIMTANVPQAPQARKVSKVRQDLLDLQARMDNLENKVLQANQGLQDLLGRLENVVVNAKQYWYHRTTLLHWMIIILVLIVLDRLLSHFPQIAAIVAKLL
jgi:hypothetical protein